VNAALAPVLAELFGPGTLVGLRRIAGGASKEAWALDYEASDQRWPLLLRRAAGGVIYRHTLSLEHEFRVLQAAFVAGVRVPRPYRYLADLEGREAFLVERLEGESIGRRVVTRPELESAREQLPRAMAAELAKIHALSLGELAFLPGPGAEPAAAWLLREAYAELDALDEPHPALELALRWLADHPPRPLPLVVCHGDFRVGNLLVGPEGLRAVLDWEFAHRGDPREDLGWPLVRAWRFGRDDRRLGGVGAVEPFVAHYNALTGRDVTVDELDWWELFGNVRWGIGALAQARRHLRGEARDLELAVLGRLAGEMEYEVLALLERRMGE
jgi:aminoglycoside phosphotransferase (APT) family kinase protein